MVVVCGDREKSYLGDAEHPVGFILCVSWGSNECLSRFTIRGSPKLPRFTPVSVQGALDTPDRRLGPRRLDALGYIQFKG